VKKAYNDEGMLIYADESISDSSGKKKKPTPKIKKKKSIMTIITKTM
jgi:hypothetical protein